MSETLKTDDVEAEPAHEVFNPCDIEELVAVVARSDAGGWNTIAPDDREAGKRGEEAGESR